MILKTAFVLPFIYLISFKILLAQDNQISITIHLRGVFESKINLLPLSGPNTLKPVLVVEGIKNGGATFLNVPDENIPGEFVLRFDYKESEKM